jgi:hypothetical protein
VQVEENDRRIAILLTCRSSTDKNLRQRSTAQRELSDLKEFASLTGFRWFLRRRW